MDRRTTSAGYRLPVGQTSNVHRSVSNAAPKTGTSANRRKDTTEHNEVAQNKIWREQVYNEWKGVKLWEKHYGFMKDFDPRGRPITPYELPDKEPVYSENLPNTKGHEYGSRVNTEVGSKMIEMEFLFHSDRRKTKMGNEFVCY